MDQSTIKSSIKNTLKEYNKKPEDIKYVSYYIGNYLQTRQEFYCTYDEFMNIAGDQYMFNLNWMGDIKFVADDWWITCDMRGNTYLHSLPVQPKKYRIPELNLITNKFLAL